MTTHEILGRLQTVRSAGPNTNTWKALCPAHEDREPSLSIKRGDDGTTLLTCFAGCEKQSIVEALGLTMADLFEKPLNGTTHTNTSKAEKGTKTVVATYDYRNEAGELLYQAVRFEPKTFRQRRPDGNNAWVWNMNGVRYVPYRLPELLAASNDATVFVVEGEKDADNMAKLGLVATTNVGGAGKWRNEYGNFLKGRKVVILPDNDDAGRKHAEQVRKALEDVAGSVKIVELPNLPDKGDVSDWIRAGGTVQRLMEMATSKSSTNGVPKLDMVTIADVQPEPVSWLWPGRIPYGKITVLDGDPGRGKSTLSVEIAARVSRGERLQGAGAAQPPAGVIIVSHEDGLADTVRPRLEAAGADLQLVHAVGNAFPRLPDDVGLIERAVLERRAKLIVIDPLTAYLAEGLSSHNDHHMRMALTPLAIMATRTGAAVLLVRHLNKREQGEAMYRGGGSIAIIGIARSGLVAAADPDDPEGKRRVLASTKNNLAPPVPSLSYQLETVKVTDSGIEVARIKWLGVSQHTANVLLNQPAAGDEDEQSAVTEATTFLKQTLQAAGGSFPSIEIVKKAKEACIAEKTLRRAKAKLKVEARKEGAGPWVWALPPQQAGKTANNGADGQVAAFEGSRHENGRNHRESREGGQGDQLPFPPDPVATFDSHQDGQGGQDAQDFHRGVDGHLGAQDPGREPL